MNLRYLASLLPFLILAGCASAPSTEEKTAEAQPPGCDRVYKVGSHMPKKDCSGPVSDAERERLQQDLNKIRPNANAIGGGGG
jgi:hypothetical protein